MVLQWHKSKLIFTCKGIHTLLFIPSHRHLPYLKTDCLTLLLGTSFRSLMVQLLDSTCDNIRMSREFLSLRQLYNFMNDSSEMFSLEAENYK